MWFGLKSMGFKETIDDELEEGEIPQDDQLEKGEIWNDFDVLQDKNYVAFLTDKKKQVAVVAEEEEGSRKPESPPQSVHQKFPPRGVIKNQPLNSLRGTHFSFSAASDKSPIRKSWTDYVCSQGEGNGDPSRVSKHKMMKGLSPLQCVKNAFDCEWGKEYEIGTSSNPSVSNNSCQSDDGLAPSTSEMGMKYTNHRREMSKKRKFNERVVPQASMAAPECPWRKRTSQSSITPPRLENTELGHNTLAAASDDTEAGAACEMVKTALVWFRYEFKLANSAEGAGDKTNRPDLVAASKLKSTNLWVNSGKAILGTVPGVEVGDKYHYRVELCIVGLHRHLEKGIDYVRKDGMSLATSIVASGVYDDYILNSDILVYCGQGGNPQRERDGKKKPADQKLKGGNLSLINSLKKQSPVRVIRGFPPSKSRGLARIERAATLFYDGLYMVEQYREVEEKLGNKVFKFELKRVPGQPKIRWP